MTTLHSIDEHTTWRKLGDAGGDTISKAPSPSFTTGKTPQFLVDNPQQTTGKKTQSSSTAKSHDYSNARQKKPTIQPSKLYPSSRTYSSYASRTRHLYPAGQFTIRAPASIAEQKPASNTEPSHEVALEGRNTNSPRVNTAEQGSVSKSFKQIVKSWVKSRQKQGALPSDSSYARLIGEAILRHPKRRLSSKRICKDIMKQYPWFEYNKHGGWQAKIVAELSQNDLFEPIAIRRTGRSTEAIKWRIATSEYSGILEHLQASSRFPAFADATTACNQAGGVRREIYELEARKEPQELPLGAQSPSSFPLKHAMSSSFSDVATFSLAEPASYASAAQSPRRLTYGQELLNNLPVNTRSILVPEPSTLESGHLQQGKGKLPENSFASSWDYPFPVPPPQSPWSLVSESLPLDLSPPAQAPEKTKAYHIGGAFHQAQSHDPKPAPTNTRATITSSTAVPPASSTTDAPGEESGDDPKEDEDDQDDNRKRKRFRSPDRSGARPRFLCIYHVHSPVVYGGQERRYLTCAGPGFEYMSGLLRHLSRTHDDHVCNRCMAIFASKRAMETHLVCCQQRLGAAQQDRWQRLFQAKFPEDSRDVSLLARPDHLLQERSSSADSGLRLRLQNQTVRTTPRSESSGRHRTLPVSSAVDEPVNIDLRSLELRVEHLEQRLPIIEHMTASLQSAIPGNNMVSRDRANLCQPSASNTQGSSSCDNDALDLEMTNNAGVNYANPGRTDMTTQEQQIYEMLRCGKLRIMVSDPRAQMAGDDYSDKGKQVSTRTAGSSMHSQMLTGLNESTLHQDNRDVLEHLFDGPAVGHLSANLDFGGPMDVWTQTIANFSQNAVTANGIPQDGDLPNYSCEHQKLVTCPIHGDICKTLDLCLPFALPRPDEIPAHLDANMVDELESNSNAVVDGSGHDIAFMLSQQSSDEAGLFDEFATPVH